MPANDARFWDRIAKRYARQPIADEAAYQHKLDVTRSYFHPEMRILELGCGTGSTALVHAPYVQHIDAVDLSPKMLAIAKDKAAGNGVKNINFHLGDANTFVAEQPYDMVLALSLFHLLDDRDVTIRHMRSLLNTGGLLVSSTACLGDMALPYRMIGALSPVGRRLGVLPLVRVFTEQQLAQSMTDNGFAIEHQWRPHRNKAVFMVARKETLAG